MSMQTFYDDFAEEFVSSESRQSNSMADWLLIMVTTLLFAMGLISIYSATYEAGMSEYFTKQLLFGIVGAGIMLSIMFMPERWLFDYAYIFYGLAMLLLIAVIVVGKTVYGSKSWLTIGPLTFQPSELGKIATLLAVARSISSRGRDLSSWSDLIIPILLFVFPISLIMLEPDFGSASVYGVTFLGIMFWGGANINLIMFLVGAPISVIMGFIGREWVFLSSVLFGSVPMILKRDLMKTLALLLFFIAIGFSSRYVYGVLKPHQQSRIQTFLNPDNDPRGRGYHVIQSIMAVGSGGLTGKGFLHGTQTQLRYIPKHILCAYRGIWFHWWCYCDWIADNINHAMFVYCQAIRQCFWLFVECLDWSYILLSCNGEYWHGNRCISSHGDTFAISQRWWFFTCDEYGIGWNCIECV
jgi:rod shape determining protein RodA